jgi:hypothetical protein
MRIHENENSKSESRHQFSPSNTNLKIGKGQRLHASLWLMTVLCLSTLKHGRFAGTGMVGKKSHSHSTSKLLILLSADRISMRKTCDAFRFHRHVFTKPSARPPAPQSASTTLHRFLPAAGRPAPGRNEVRADRCGPQIWP